MTQRTNADARPDLWGEERGWETTYGPGQLLDGWRYACSVLETLAEMNQNAGAESEMLYVALTHALQNARAEAAHFEEEVRMRLSWNKAHGRLTPFGRVLRPMMDRAGYETAAQLLFAAGKMEEEYATEILERLMHGPETPRNLGGYLEGFPEALGLPGEADDGGRVQRMRLSSTLMHFAHPDHAESIAREAEAEAEADYMPPPSPDAAGPLSDANAALSAASDRLEGSDDDPPEVLERKRLAGMAVAEAGLLVASEQRRQQREGGGS